MPKRIAICIGINEYKNRPSVNLNFAQSDAKAIKSILEDDQRGAFDMVHAIYDDDATSSKINEILNNTLLDPALRSDDLVFVYFSGHGALDQGENLFLVPYDVEFNADDSVKISTTIHVKQLEILLDNTKAGNVILILDACHSGGAGKLIGQIKYDDQSNIIVIGAARFSEKAWETPEIEHGRFTDSLLKSINQVPSHGQWITLSQVLSFIQKDIANTPSTITQTMEVTSHAIDQNIDFFKNPMFSLSSESFTKQVEYLCSIVNSTISPTQFGKTLPYIFVLDEPHSFGRSVYTLVICLDNSVANVSEEDIKQINMLFEDYLSEGQITSAMLVTRNELSPRLTSFLHNAVTSYTINKLLRNLLNFDRYLKRLIFEFAENDPERKGEPAPKKYYVELDAKKRITMTDVLRKIEKMGKDEGVNLKNKNLKTLIKTIKSNKELNQKVIELLSSIIKEQMNERNNSKTITELFTEWLSLPDERAAVILGGYGTGKTTFSRKIAYDLAQNYLNSSDKRGHRIPILFSLRRFPKVAAIDIEAAIIAHLKQTCMVSNPDFSAFREMNDAGLFVLIFDGFDEMAVQASEEIIKRNFYEIAQFATSGTSKIVITSRPEAFLTEQEEMEVLVPEDDFYSENHPIPNRIELRSLSPEQIEQFLQQRIPLIKIENESSNDWNYYLDQINNIMGLKELARRPVLLEMTIKALPRLIKEGGEVTRPRLYDNYLRGEIARQQTIKNRDFLIKDTNARLNLIEIIACYMFKEKKVELNYDEIQNILRSEFSSTHSFSLESYIRDFIACSLLIRESDKYRFSHLSFMEYLTAKRLTHEIQSDNPDIIEKHELSQAVLDFLLEFWHDEDDKWIDTLFSWIHWTKNKNKEECLHRGANSIAILKHRKQFFIGKDLSYTVLTGSDLSGAEFQNTSFLGSYLEGVDLRDANLTNTNFQNANLMNVKFGSNIFDGEVMDGKALYEHIKSSVVVEK